MTTLGIITLLFSFAESGEKVVDFIIKVEALFRKIMMEILVENGGREAGNHGQK